MLGLSLFLFNSFGGDSFLLFFIRSRSLADFFFMKMVI